MPAGGLHDNTVHTDVALVGRLLAAQFPRWADLPICPSPSAGVDNTLYRLGDDMVVRLPRSGWSGARVDKEQRWLPWLAPRLPVAIPAPLGRGRPAEGYPWPWSVYRWLDGENPTSERIADPRALATALAGFVAALRRIDPTGGPPAGQPLALKDAPVRAAIDALRGMIDTDAVTAAWDAALRLPAWTGPPVWFHGDLAPGNVLLVNGRLSAVIDFAGMGVGDPSDDVRVAWNLLPADAREIFRAALRMDDATWARGRGHALAQALAQLLHYRDTHPAPAATVRQVLRAILAAPPDA
jgi:aminoglycoside phosphotransferase (APT) family kinase protein